MTDENEPPLVALIRREMKRGRFKRIPIFASVKNTHIPLPSIQFIFPYVIVFTISSCATPAEDLPTERSAPIPGAEQIDDYLPLLVDKQVGITLNHSALVGDAWLLDTLLGREISVVRIFGPEHSVRGNVDDGVAVNDTVDVRTGTPVVSLYGSDRKPQRETIDDLDVMVFDIQDVGARFYTYISTMHYVMQACAENGIPMIVLDRPNPNSHYIDGPVRQKGFESWVGVHPIPVVHGMTVGELAQMINGEGWLGPGLTVDLTVIPVANYTHSTPYSLPVRPSPNLPNDHSILWYPSLSLFQGTVISVGRGTDFPHQVIGYPDSSFGSFVFYPISIPGVSTNPPHLGDTCNGIDLRPVPPPQRLDITYLIRFYNIYQSLGSQEKPYFNSYFKRLAGTDQLQKQIVQGLSEEEIRSSWTKDLEAFKAKRKGYLLYPDFE